MIDELTVWVSLAAGSTARCYHDTDRRDCHDKGAHLKVPTPLKYALAAGFKRCKDCRRARRND